MYEAPPDLTVIVSRDGTTVSFQCLEVGELPCLSDFMEHWVYSLLTGIGYHPDTICKHIGETP